jgi:TIR domain
MSTHVFLSYSDQDRIIAEQVCATLERAEIKCWMASRDVPLGASWASAIIEAIENSRMMIVIASANCNASIHVMREVERAVHRRVSVIPLRVDATPYSRELEFFLSPLHWVDASVPPIEPHLQKLIARIHALKSPVPLGAPADRAERVQDSPSSEPHKEPDTVEVPLSSPVLEPVTDPVTAKEFLPMEPEAISVPPRVPLTAEFEAMTDGVVRASADVCAQVERVLAVSDWGSKYEQNRDFDAAGTKDVWTDLSVVPRAALVRSLLDLLSEAGSWRTEWQCLVLLRYALKAAGGREHVPAVIAVLVPYLRDRIGSVQEAAFHLLKEVPMPLRLKWETFLRAWPGSSMTASSWLCRPIVEYCPFTERGRTGAAVAQALENRLCHLNNAVWALRELNYRQGAGVLRTMLVEDVSDLVPSTGRGDDVVYTASVLAEWDDKEAIPFIKEAIDLTHPRLAYRVSELLHCLLKIDGEASVPYAVDLVIDLEPPVQLHFLERGPGVHRCGIPELLPTVARMLAAKDLHQDVRTAVNEILAGAGSEA